MSFLRINRFSRKVVEAAEVRGADDDASEWIEGDAGELGKLHVAGAFVDRRPPPARPIASPTEVATTIPFDGGTLVLVEADRVKLNSAYIAALGGAEVTVQLASGPRTLRLVEVIRIMEAWHGAA